MTRTILQISDCHLVVPGAELLGVDTQRSLEAVLDQALARGEPDLVLASGDIAHDPLPDVYARFAATVRAQTTAPLMCLPGNHDVLDAMKIAELPLAPVAVGDWQVVPLDSHEDDAPVALITDTDREFVRAALAHTTARHCLIATHHPMVTVNCPWLDRDRIQNGSELVEWLSECSAVDGTSRLRGVVFGHAHQIVEDRVAGVPVWGAPSTCFQFLPESDKFSLDTRPPGYRWLRLADDGSIATEVERVRDFRISPAL